ncbi:MAG: glycosyltransferase family 2 protein [Sphingomonadales bacterium]|nr:glycosyltransferase family 2 protein [Sphingomonadales bacterium]MDE2168526.1 glycosyltransferase family 2 protein [Sphingomonadales bacterium]
MVEREDAQGEAVRDASDVLIVIPCLNEEAHLPGLLAQQVADNPGARIVVADGGSQDRSREIALEWAQKHPCVHLLNNPAGLQSAGVNLAVRSLGKGASWIVRIDAHCSYPRQYVAGLLRAAVEHDATSVVVPMMTQGDEGFQSAVAAAQNSLLGNGGAPHRNLGRGRFVDHGHHALFDLSLFMKAGGYDESFSHNEDAELDYRLRGLGGRIWLEPSQAIVYYPRRSPGRLLRQYLGYGRGRAQNWRRHRMPMALRQAMPLAIAPVVVLGMLGAAMAALTPLCWVMALPMIGWAILCCLYGVALAWRQRRASVLYAGVAAMIMHLGWSMGFLYELRPFVVRGMKPNATASR